MMMHRCDRDEPRLGVSGFDGRRPRCSSLKTRPPWCFSDMLDYDVHLSHMASERLWHGLPGVMSYIYSSEDQMPRKVVVGCASMSVLRVVHAQSMSL